MGIELITLEVIIMITYSKRSNLIIHRVNLQKSFSGNFRKFGNNDHDHMLTLQSIKHKLLTGYFSTYNVEAEPFQYLILSLMTNDFEDIFHTTIYS